MAIIPSSQATMATISPSQTTTATSPPSEPTVATIPPSHSPMRSLQCRPQGPRRETEDCLGSFRPCGGGRGDSRGAGAVSQEVWAGRDGGPRGVHTTGGPATGAGRQTLHTGGEQGTCLGLVHQCELAFKVMHGLHGRMVSVGVLEVRCFPVLSKKRNQ